MSRQAILVLLLASMLLPGATARAQSSDNCIAVSIETSENLAGVLDEMGIGYRRVTFDDLKDEALLGRLCTLFIGDGTPTNASLDIGSALERWVRQGGALYLSGETRLLLSGIVGTQVTFDAAKIAAGNVEAQILDRGLAMATAARLPLRYPTAAPLIARTTGRVLASARVRTESGYRDAPLAVQFDHGRGAVLYSTIINRPTMALAEQNLTRALALRLIYARQAQALLRRHPALPNAAVHIATLADPNSAQVYKYVVREGQDFDAVLYDPGGQLTLSAISPVTTTRQTALQNVLVIRAPAGGEWSIQVRPSSSSARRWPYLLLIIPRLGTNLLNSIPTPLRVSTDLRVLGTNAALALALTLLLGLGAVLWNDRLPAEPEARSRVAQVAGAVGQRLAFAYNLACSPTTWNVTGIIRRLVLALALAVFLALGALIASMLDHRFAPTTPAGIGLFAGLFIAIGLTSLIFTLAQKLAATLMGEASALRLRPWGLLVTGALVVASYVLKLLPGFAYALTAGVTLKTIAAQERRRPALVAIAGLTAVALTGSIAWLLTIPTDLLWRNLASGASSNLGAAGMTVIDSLQSLVLLIFFIALQLVFFELLPLGKSAGGVLFRWNGWIWGILALLTSLLMFHGLVNPSAHALELAGNRSIILLATGLGLYTVAAIAVWLAVRGSGLTGKGPRPSRGALVALALSIALWLAICACGILITVGQMILARVGR